MNKKEKFCNLQFAEKFRFNIKNFIGFFFIDLSILSYMIVIYAIHLVKMFFID